MGNRATICNRESGPDIVRFIACLFVVAVHFYLNVGYYNEVLSGTRMFIMTSARWLFISCVPMFFMLTGYFKINKRADKNHYKALIGLFISYIVISLLKMVIYNYLYGKIYTFTDMLKNLGNYQIAWYMGMYLCLFVLIPFLNKMYHALDDREKIILLVTMMVLCCIYPLFNYIVPYYFYGLYPVMYYFIGAYIREKQFEFNRLLLIAIAVCISVLEAFISFSFTKTGVFDWTVISTADGTYGTLFIAVTAICIFLAFYKVTIKQEALKRLLAVISNVSFEIYLFAGIYDAVIYQYLKRTIIGANEFFWWFFATVPLSFVCAVVSAVIFKKLISVLSQCLSRMNRSGNDETA